MLTFWNWQESWHMILAASRCPSRRPSCWRYWKNQTAWFNGDSMGRAMRAARRETGRRKRWFVLCLVVVLAGALYLLSNGYRFRVGDSRAVKRVVLYREWEGMLNPRGDVAGEVTPGDRCRLVQVGAKTVANFRIRCGNLDGWTADGNAFDPPLKLDLWEG
ncbi:MULTISPECIES: hypothetical protein [Cupriavidus]